MVLIPAHEINTVAHYCIQNYHPLRAKTVEITEVNQCAIADCIPFIGRYTQDYFTFIYQDYFTNISTHNKQ